MEKTYNFYAVVGPNGVGVMSTHKGANDLKRYIKCAKITGFDNFVHAEFWALSRFRELSPYGHRLTYLILDHAIFNKNLASGRF